MASVFNINKWNWTFSGIILGNPGLVSVSVNNQLSHSSGERAGISIPATNHSALFSHAWVRSLYLLFLVTFRLGCSARRWSWAFAGITEDSGKYVYIKYNHFQWLLPPANRSTMLSGNRLWSYKKAQTKYIDLHIEVNIFSTSSVCIIPVCTLLTYHMQYFI